MQGSVWSRVSRHTPAAAIVVVVASLVTACGAPGVAPGVNTTVPIDQQAKVTRGTIRTTIGASGVVAPLQEVLLNFSSGATVKTVNVAVGQRVRKDDILGTIDTADLQLALQQQVANVTSAKAKYDQVAAGATAKDVEVAKSNVDAAQAKYQATATINPKDIEVARANVDSAVAGYNAVLTGTVTPQDIANAEASLRSAIAKYNAVLQGTTTPQDIANAEASVRSAQAKLDTLKAGSLKADLISAQNKVASAQTALDKTKSDSANAKEQARINWEKSADATRSSQRAFDIANATYQQAKSTNRDPSSSSGGTTGSAVAAIPTITPLRLETLKQTADSAFLTVQQAEKTQEGNRLTYENTKTAEIQNIATAQASLNDAQAALSKLLAGPTQEDVTQAQAAVDQAKASLDKLKRGPTDTDVAQAQAAVDQARAQLDKLKRGPTDADIAKAQASVDSARATLNDLLRGPKQTDLQQAQATVDSANATLRDLQAGAKPADLATAIATVRQAEAQRDQAQLKLDQSTLKAPFAGIVTQVNVVIGQITGGGGATTGTTTSSNAFDVVDDSELHIDVNVSESDVGSVQVGQTAQITLDSVPGQPQQGNVQRINPVATTTSNVTAFPVRITLAQNAANSVRSGANATVQIVTNQRANVLTVPSRAVTQISGQPAVTVLFSNSTFLVPIRTGITDGRNTEVISGLQEGDIVVVPRAGAAAPRPPGG